jgi:3-phenylpropionate/cinnamic acid dioxygenase small subunit
MPDNPDFDDWLAICNLKAAYCRLLDTKDWEGWGQLFTEDIVADTTGSGGTVMKGRDNMVAMVSQSLAQAKTAHQVHSPEITVEGHEARAIWAMQDRVVWGERSLTGYGHYTERYVRTAEGWKIAEQALTRLHMDMDGI